MDDNTQPEIDTIWNEAKSFIKQGNFDTVIETTNQLAQTVKKRSRNSTNYSTKAKAGPKVVRGIRVQAIIKKAKYNKDVKYVC